MGNALSAAYSAMPLRGVIPTPPATSTAGRVSCRTKSPIGPKTRTSSLGWRPAKARLYGESERRTAYSRWGRVGLVARDMGRASMPSSVCSWRNVNCVGRNVKPAGFSGSIARVLGVSGREDTIRVRKPRGGPANPSTSSARLRNPTAVFRDLDWREVSRRVAFGEDLTTTLQAMLLRFRAIQWIRGQRAAFLAFALPLQAGLKIILYHSSWLVERVGPLDVVALQGRLRSFAAERNWERFHSPKNLAMAVASEAGELVDVFQW